MRALTSLKDRPTLVGALVMAGFCLSLYVAVIATRGLPGQKNTLVTASFSDVGALRAGDDVRQSSLRIGRVRSVDYEGGLARVVLQLDGDREVYRDATAQVWARSALGQKFIELKPGTAASGTLERGEAIPVAQTAPPEELDNLLEPLDRKTRKQVASTLQETGGGLAGHSQDLNDLLGSAPDLLQDLGTVSKAVDSDEEQLVSMLQRATTLSGRFQGRQQEIANLMRNLTETVEAVGVDDGAPLGATIQYAPDTLNKARVGLDSLHEPLLSTRSAMQALRPGAEALAAGTPSLRSAMRESLVPLRKVPRVAKLAGPAVGDLTSVTNTAQPVVPMLGKAVSDLSPVVSILSPYSPEVFLFFKLFGEALSDGDAAGNWLRLDVLANTESVSGSIPLKDPLTARNPYPAPGAAKNDRK